MLEIIHDDQGLMKPSGIGQMGFLRTTGPNAALEMRRFSGVLIEAPGYVAS